MRTILNLFILSVCFFVLFALFGIPISFWIEDRGISTILSFVYAALITYFLGRYLFKKEVKRKIISAKDNAKTEKPIKPFSLGGFSNYRMLDTMVAGSNFQNEDGLHRFHHIRNIEEFDTIVLKREPENEFDPNAIPVFDSKGENQLGYLPRKYTRWLGKEMDQGRKVYAYYKRTLTQGDYPIPVILIELEI
ncbi:MAG TPA: hypothetical protein ENH60_03110, partial [Pricia sp.]|nr:hypothetical protein [Pricia sp.]